MYWVILFLKVIHVVLCVGLVFFVLIQSSKGGGLSGAFGTGAETFFGYSQANKKLARLTTYCAVGFFLTCLTLGILPSQKAKQASIVDTIPMEEMPAAPGPISPLDNPDTK